MFEHYSFLRLSIKLYFSLGKITDQLSVTDPNFYQKLHLNWKK